MSQTIHAKNWLKPSHTVCGIHIDLTRQVAANPKNITCSTCALRVFRTGQRIGLNVEKTPEWTWKQLEAWTGEE